MNTLKLYTDVIYTSSIGKIDIYWVIWTIFIFSVSLFMDIINQFLVNIHLAAGSPVVHLAVLVLVNWMFYRGYKRSRTFLGLSQKDRSFLKQRPKNKIETDVMQKQILKIENCMEKDRLYLDPGITVKDFAYKLQIPSRKLSSIINQGFNKNFVGFINDYRIELAKERFKNPIDAKETILEIMYDVGFNSKSSFYTIFKQKTGHTPSEYKKIHAKKKIQRDRFFQKQFTYFF